MGAAARFEDSVKDVGRKIDDQIFQPVIETVEAVVEDPVALAAVALSIAAPGIGTAIGSALGASGTAATVIGNAVVQGAVAEAQGGDFLKGAALSAIGGAVVPGVTAGVADALGGGVAANVASNALTGGVMSELSGGDFTSGALMSGIGSGINEARLAAADRYLDSLPGGQGVYTDDLPDMSDFDLPPAVIDTSFTPDYSLSSGAPVIPDMGAQGIQVPTINEIVDVVNQPVDYSLPIPSGNGLGLQMPTVPTDLGDPNSFINQPAPDVSVNIPELPEQGPVDTDTELGLLNAAKNLTPLVVGSLLADKVINQQEDQPTGFSIVPIPGDWRSPEYNMAFTPSEAIDFGNVGMLAGTQFARQPMGLSSLINSLNTPQQFGMNEIVGSINDVPMSINDIINNLGQNTMQPFDMNQTIGQLDNAPASLNSIISGIQSQYG
jgi:hypothetical protein